MAVEEMTFCIGNAFLLSDFAVFQTFKIKNNYRG
jgi:hypothetical protein